MAIKIYNRVFFIALCIFLPTIVLAQEIVKSPDFCKLEQNKHSTECQGFTNIGEYVVAIVEKILPIIISGAILVLIYAGFKYITSQGNPDATNQAKSLIEGVILGLLVLFLVGLFIAFLTG